MYSYPHNVKHPFDIFYVPNSCKASTESVFLPSHDQLFNEVDARDISVNFINFKRDIIITSSSFPPENY